MEKLDDSVGNNEQKACHAQPLCRAKSRRIALTARVHARRNDARLHVARAKRCTHVVPHMLRVARGRWA
jgi:hypothetical protein